MTDRDMSYELDGIFNTRNAGELVTVRQTRTKIRRSPGLAPAARMSGGDVQNLTPALSHPMRSRRPRNISPGMARSLGLPMARSLSNPIYRVPNDLGDITLPLVGTVSVMTLLLAAAGGFAAYKFLK